MNIFSLIRFIVNHPLNRHHKLKAILRFFKWQINTRLNAYPIIYPYTEHAKLIVGKGMTGATGNLYCGLHEYNDMAFLLHFLREDDLFIDAGANIGSYTVLASGHVGAFSYSFEPVPKTFSHLENNIRINNIAEKVKAYNIALGATQGYVDFTSAHDSMNHVAKNGDTGVIKVPIDTLDNLIQKQKPALLKIDVEGFETEVLNGAQTILSSSELKAIIIELNGSGANYGYSEEALHQTLTGLGFKPFHYTPEQRLLTTIDKRGNHNTIYIRDLNFVMTRLLDAPKVKILNSEI